MTEKEKDDSMNLAPGVTCDSCYAFYFCKGIGCTKPGATRCDYYPNRYFPKRAGSETGAPDLCSSESICG